MCGCHFCIQPVKGDGSNTFSSTSLPLDAALNCRFLWASQVPAATPVPVLQVPVGITGSCSITVSCIASSMVDNIKCVWVESRAFPDRLRIGEEYYDFAYERMWGMNIWRCVHSCVYEWVEPRPLKDTRLWLFKINGSWMAAHALMDCSTVAEVLQGMQPVFSSDENILEEGPHVWNYFRGKECQPLETLETLHLR